MAAGLVGVEELRLIRLGTLGLLALVQGPLGLRRAARGLPRGALVRERRWGR